jgi:hypothetical protein
MWFPILRRRLNNRLWQISLAQQAVRIRLVERLISLTADKEVMADIESRIRDSEATRANAEMAALHQAIGSTLTGWAEMEVLLVGIVADLLETPRDRAGVVMYSVLNFHTWLSIISELLPLDDRYSGLIPQWNTIAGKLRGMKDTRDRLAHHTTHQRPQEMPLKKATLSPARLDLRSKVRKREPLTFHQITEFSHSVSRMIHSLAALSGAMTEAYTKHGPLPGKAFQRYLYQGRE